MKWKLRKGNDAAANQSVTPWGSLTWLASDELTGSKMTVGRVVIKTGCANPGHLHDNCEEVLYLLAGQLTHWIGEESVVMKPGDTIVIPAGMPHHACASGPVDADMIVTYDSGKRGFKKAE
jgi:quercetin dioxygenase-like cupin family protein